MIIVHGIWADGSLHVWGERSGRATTSSTSADPSGDPCSGEPTDGSGAEAGRSFTVVNSASVGSGTLPALELRRCIGDAWDSLLVSGSSDSELKLRLPAVNRRADTGRRVTPELHVQTVPTLAFSPADAVDLLTSLPPAGLTDVRRGASIRYWTRVAALVLELLAKQRFAPALHHSGADRYCGYWRIVIDDDETSERLGALIASMPPVCRSVGAPGADIQASTTVENFLWTTVDALVRRCLEGDELADAIRDRAGWDASPQMRWLRSLVSVDPRLDGPSHERDLVCDAARSWVAKLERDDRGGGCRTCFQLHAPADTTADQESTSPTGWRLTVHVQAVGQSGWVVDAAQLWDAAADHPKILQRPFADVREQVLADLQHAARYCAPLGRWSGPPEPMEFALSLDEAYRFLRDAAPVLKLEGHGVWLPRWWHDNRPRLHLGLEIRPAIAPEASHTAAFGLDTLVDYDWRIALGDEDVSADELRSLAQAQEPLVRLRGRWTEVQPRDIETALQFVEGQRGGTMTVLEGIRQSYVVDHRDTGLPVAGLRAQGWIQELLCPSEPGAGVEAVPAPTGFLGELRPYQLQGLAWLWFLTRHGLGGCLADDMGLGKTIQLIALWLYERQERPSPGPTLLIVPMSLVGNWQREIDRFAPSLNAMVHHGLERLTGQEFIDEVAKHDVVISTYGLAHRDLEHLAAVNWHRIALDEAQNIKNPAAKQSVAMRSLRAVHRVALTGTPVENRLSELWSILEFLNASYLGSAGSFRRRFAVPIERHHDTDRAQRLRRLIQPFVLRRLKTDPDVRHDLPDKMQMKVFCNLTREQAALYEAVVSDMLGQIDRSGGIQRRGLILATLVKLKQVCNHPAHFLADESSLPHRSGKCDRITEMLEVLIAEGDRALVFTQFRRMGMLLQKLLRETFGFDTPFLHGGTNRMARERMVKQFQARQEDTPVFLLSLKAGGFGLNLTAANHVFHFDRWWNPAVENQATDRVHRIGQCRQVQVHKFVSIGTLEERIDTIIERKQALAQNVLGSGEAWLTELSTGALHELFALSRDAVAED